MKKTLSLFFACMSLIPSLSQGMERNTESEPPRSMYKDMRSESHLRHYQAHVRQIPTNHSSKTNRSRNCNKTRAVPTQATLNAIRDRLNYYNTHGHYPNSNNSNVNN